MNEKVRCITCGRYARAEWTPLSYEYGEWDGAGECSRCGPVDLLPAGARS